jgi:uncharacterized protein (DUF488 family)
MEGLPPLSPLDGRPQRKDAVPSLLTIGHSTRPIDAFRSALEAHGIRRVADVRAFPASRRYPWFERGALERALADAGVGYSWLGASLGGRRRARGKPSRNVAVRNESFRAYADHMATDDFRRGVRELLALARDAPTAAMCAELLWWRCHRSFLADHVVLVEGWDVLHVRDEGPPDPHRPRREARVVDGGLVYDGGVLPFA